MPLPPFGGHGGRASRGRGSHSGDPTYERKGQGHTAKFESLKDEDTSVMVEKVVSESLAISLGSLSAGMGCSSSVSRRAEVLVLKVPAWPLNYALG